MNRRSIASSFRSAFSSPQPSKSSVNTPQSSFDSSIANSIERMMMVHKRQNGVNDAEAAARVQKEIMKMVQSLERRAKMLAEIAKIRQKIASGVTYGAIRAAQKARAPNRFIRRGVLGLGQKLGALEAERLQRKANSIKGASNYGKIMARAENMKRSAINQSSRNLELKIKQIDKWAGGEMSALASRNARMAAKKNLLSQKASGWGSRALGWGRRRNAIKYTDPAFM